jgi:glycosyltransferase involved in cell wall biosynthesis
VLTSTFPRRAADTDPAFVFDLCRRLAAEWDVTVLAPHSAGAQCIETLDGVCVLRYRYAPAAWEKLAYEGGLLANLKRRPWLAILLPSFFLSLLWALRHALRTLKPAAVHAHWIVPQGIALAVLLPRNGPRPRAICTAHGSDVTALRGVFWKMLRRYAAVRLDRIVAVSTPLKAQLVEEGCTPERIDVIPMGTDLSVLFTPAGQPARCRLDLLFVGRLVREKGVDLLLEAMPRILSRHPEVMLTLVGDGPEKAGLQDTAKRLGLGEQVRFVGPQAQAALPEYFQRAALLILPSRREGFGLVLIEALGCGCPVLAADLPAMRELLDGGCGGRLFRPGDPDQLARAAIELLADPTAAAALARNGRARVLERYDWRVIARRYGELLAEAPSCQHRLSRESHSLCDKTDLNSVITQDKLPP